MTFTEAIRSVITQYTGFGGRARRSEYWYYFLFECIVNFALSGLAQFTGLNLFNTLIGLFNLALLLPGLAVCFRRMHDTGKSAWYLLIGLIPVLGQILVMLWFLKDSEPGTNQYGPNPKGQW